MGEQLRLVLSEALLDPQALPDIALELLLVALEKVADRLDSDPNRSCRFVLVDILKREVRRPRVLDDLLDNRVDRRIVPALKAREFERNQVGMARSELGGPDFLVGVLGVAVLPDIRDIEGILDKSGVDIRLEERPHEVIVDRQRVDRQHRIAEFLQLVRDLVVHAGIVVIGPR